MRHRLDWIILAAGWLAVFLLLAAALNAGPCGKPIAEAPAWCLMLFQ